MQPNVVLLGLGIVVFGFLVTMRVKGGGALVEGLPLGLVLIGIVTFIAGLLLP